MILRWLAVAVALLALGTASCRKKQIVQGDNIKGPENIPREYAVKELRALLPTAETIVCAAPKDTWKPSEIREWVIEGDFVELRFAKGIPVKFGYGELTKTDTFQSGRVYYVRLFTEAMQGREHYSFGWKEVKTAKDVHELFEAVRRKQ